MDRTTDSSAPLAAAVPLPAVQRGRALAVAAVLALIAWCVAWELWLAPLRPGGSWLALKALPLCVPLAGMLRHRLYTYRWLSLMIWLYVCEGLVRATSDRAPSSWCAMVEVALCLAVFVSSVAYIRRRQRAGRTPSR